MSSQSNKGHVTLNTLGDRKRAGTKFAALTAYDALFAELISSAGVEVILVGDSLGMVLQGHDSTLPVTLDDMVYHMNCVHRGNRGALIMADLPFMSYASERQSLKSAATLMRAGAHVVKLEGGAWLAESSRLLTERGIPVCAHMGLTPQSINRIGGYRVQGRDPDQAHSMIEEALILEEAGASILLLECVPVDLAKESASACTSRRSASAPGRTRWPDHGDARHARHHAAVDQSAEVHQEFSRRKSIRNSGRVQGVRRRGARRRVPRARTLLQLVQTFTTIDAVRAALAARRGDARVGLVPTMGNLHEGHWRSSPKVARRATSRVVSVFVNPMQFGPNEDFEAYPRTLQEDAALLERSGADMLFAPTEQEMYPHGRGGHTTVSVPRLANILCGAYRPGHFDGVATVVLKLFNIVAPDRAFFGEKDFQQLTLIRTFCAELDLPIEITGVPIVRAADGLALSSRNRYLAPDERAIGAVDPSDTDPDHVTTRGRQPRLRNARTQRDDATEQRRVQRRLRIDPRLL